MLACAAYRLDIALEPGLNRFQFDESYLYTPTFSVRHIEKPQRGSAHSQIPGSTDQPLFSATEDASILRGVETFASTPATFSKIREQILDPDAYSVTDIRRRYSSLLNMLQRGQDVTSNHDELVHNDSRWNISKQESWLASDVPQLKKLNDAAISTTTAIKNNIPNAPITQSRSGRKIQKRTYLDCLMN